MKSLKYITLLLFTLAILFGLCSTVQTYEKVSALSAENTALKSQIDSLEKKSAQMAAYKAQIDSLTRQITQMQQATLRERTDYLDRGGERGTKLIMHCTAFWEGSCGKEPSDPLYGITASGEYMRDGIVAAGPHVPLGTKIYIPYFGKTFVVKDRGSAIDDGDLDVYMPTAAECFRFGVKDLEVWVLE